MDYRNLGAAGLRVSAVGVGCNPFGNVRTLEIVLTDDDLAEIDRLTLVDEDRSFPPIFRTRA